VIADAAMRGRAKTLADSLRAGGGVARAAELVLAHVAARR